MPCAKPTTIISYLTVVNVVSTKATEGPTIMDKSLGQRSNPSPHPTNNVGRVYPEFFSEFQLCIGWGEGELQENFEKDALF